MMATTSAVNSRPIATSFQPRRARKLKMVQALTASRMTSMSVIIIGEVFRSGCGAMP